MKGQTAIVGVLGILVGIILAMCFFRAASFAFSAFSFLFWVVIGLILVGAVYSFLMRRWRA